MDALPFPTARSLAHPARKWLELFTRWGFIANGIVYLIIGVLAVRWALGAGGELIDPEGAFREMLRKPFGKPLLMALIPGFFSYAAWRLLAAFYDSERDGNSWGGLFARGFGVLKGILYAGLGMSAVRLAFHTSAGESTWVPGPMILLVVAIGLLGFACFEMYRAFRAKLSQSLQLRGPSAGTREWIVRVSRFGIGARGLVIGAFAVLLFRSAAAGRAHVPAAQQSLHFLGRVHPTLYLLGGAGILAYGIYLLVLARYRRIETV
jgi:hypothetical protein